MPTLTSADIRKIEDLYRKLERLHAERQQIKGATIENMTGLIRRGTSGVENVHLRDFSAEAQNEIRDVLARDLRRRAAKIVETLHKYGCEAKLTEE